MWGGPLQVFQQYLVCGDNQKCLTLTGEMCGIIYTPSPSLLLWIPPSPFIRLRYRWEKWLNRKILWNMIMDIQRMILLLNNVINITFSPCTYGFSLVPYVQLQAACSRYLPEGICKLGWVCLLMMCPPTRWVYHALVVLASETLRSVYHVVGCPSPCPVRDGSAAGCIELKPDNVLGGSADQWVHWTGWGSN